MVVDGQAGVASGASAGLQVVGGMPVMMFARFASEDKRWFTVQELKAQGHTWGTPAPVPGGGTNWIDADTQLLEVSGHLAAVFFDSSTGLTFGMLY